MVADMVLPEVRMTGWVAEPQLPPLVEDGVLAVAGLGRRVGAWILPPADGPAA
jgi:hypothetical protein